jgi:hypothetical protein
MTLRSTENVHLLPAALDQQEAFPFPGLQEDVAPVAEDEKGLVGQQQGVYAQVCDQRTGRFTVVRQPEAFG